jgi:multicomponent Na+:H+ antiporter subunit F
MSEQTNDILNLLPIVAVLAILIPIYEAWRQRDIWQTMLALSSISTKAAVIMLIISVLRDDWSIGITGAIILTIGNGGFMLLANILKRMGT